MDKIKKPSLRTSIQVAFTAISNGYVIGFAQGKIFTGSSKIICFPGLNCYSCPGALGSCPIGSLQAVLGSRQYRFSFYILGFFLLIGAIWGRLVCGWLCPFGLFQDVLYKILFARKISKVKGDKFLRYFKYIILVIFVILLPMLVVDVTGLGNPWFCKYICPSGTLMAGLPLIAANASIRAAIGWMFTWKVAILAGITVLSILIYRPFCRYICPLGAIYGLFNKVSLYRLELDESKCIHCNKCEEACKLAIPVLIEQNSPECIRCGDCIKACAQGALFSTFGKIKSKEE